MPLFDFECPACDKSVEILVRANETPECPECGSVKLTRLLSAPAAPHTGSRAGDLPICGASAPSTRMCGLPQCGTGTFGNGMCGME
jgi:putative FmdB family regulatory protein